MAENSYNSPMRTDHESFNDLLDNFQKIIVLGLSLSCESNQDRLLDKILMCAIDICEAEGGSIYRIEDKHAKFEIFYNKKLNIHERISEFHEKIKSIPLEDENGNPLCNTIITASINMGKVIYIEDAYQESSYNLNGIHDFDKKNSYHTQSVVCVPMKNYEQKMIGGFQLINGPFTPERIALCEMLASFAAIILTQKALIQAQKDLFDALLQVIAKAIDQKSTYTSKHGRRVPIIAQMIVDAIQSDDSEYFADKKLTDNQIYELQVASWLHDCGKLAVPIHVMDKATKLEHLMDRFELIKLRAEILIRDVQLDSKLSESSKLEKITKIKGAVAFIEKLNIGGEVVTEEDLTKLTELHEHYLWTNYEGILHSFISDDEKMNLSIQRGTLNQDDRSIIESHVRLTHEMLQTLPFPDFIANVPEIAGSHHEHMDGKGYYRGLKGNQISLSARILSISDAFEALTCADRPYKPAMSLSKALGILQKFKEDGKFDPQILDLFIRKKVYLRYAKEHLNPSQIDVD